MESVPVVPLPQASQQQLLWLARGVDMTLTTDQALTKLFAGTNWIPTKVVVARKTGAFGTACAGGLYTAATKGGNAFVAAAQSYANLTGAGKMVDATLAAVAGTDVQTSGTAFLSLTTGNTGALTADVFVFGVVAD